MVWAPESATRSSTANPLDLKRLICWSMVEFARGRFGETLAAIDTFPSHLPFFTWRKEERNNGSVWRRGTIRTKWTKSLVAIARISAQDTTPGHLFSTKDLAFVIVSKASTLSSLLSSASFSASTLLPGLVDINTDPSHPYNNEISFIDLLNLLHTWKCVKVVLILLRQSSHGRIGEWWQELRRAPLWTVGR